MPSEGLESLESYLSSSLSSRKSVGVAPGMPLPTPGVLTQDPAPTMGESLGSHSVELESVLGRGGFATVWRGKWLLTTVAVKVFHESLSEKAIFKFQLEAKTLRTLRHPNICYFLDTCMLHGAPVIVLE
jgi:serine/threonine protein kinase